MSLSKAEQAELQRLLAKAKSMPCPRDVPSDDEYDGFSIYDPATGLFHNPETGECRDIWAEEELHNMTDASKRRETADPFGSDPAAKRVMKPKAKAASSMASPTTVASLPYGHGTSVSMPYPSGTSMPTQYGLDLPELPPGVPDVPTWGRTMISFGQYKNADMTYFDLVTSNDDRVKSYVKWCRAREKSAGGHLKDLCCFMAHYFRGHQDEVQSTLVIPGTDQARVLRP